MAWTATLVDARQIGLDIELDIHIADDGGETMDFTLRYSTTDPRINIAQIRSDIEHNAKALGKWAFAQAHIGQVIHSGG